MPNARHQPDQKLLKTLGENVRREREAKKLTQEALAELIDVHPRMVQKIEYGATNVLLTTALRLQAALECDWAALLPKVEVRPLLKRKKP